MSKLSISKPAVGEKNTTADPKLVTALTTLETWANGEIEGTNNIKAEGVTEANLTSAVQTLLNTKSAAALTIVKKNEATFTVASGELVIMEKEGSEVKLPAATSNRIVSIYAGVTGSITVKAAVAKTIFGDFLSTAGETTITLTANQHVILQANGTNWLIIAGEPKRTGTYEAKTYSKAELEAGVEISATRDALVAVKTGGLGGTVTIGGAAAPTPGTAQVRVPASQKLKSTVPEASNELFVLLI